LNNETISSILHWFLLLPPPIPYPNNLISLPPPNFPILSSLLALASM
jgi:hypothetical protein